MENILKLLGAIFTLLGVILVYDARRIATQRFSYQDKNEGTKILKILGFMFSIIGAILL